MSIEGHDCWEDCDEGPHGCVCGNDCPPSIRDYTPTTEEVRIKYRLSSGRQPGDFAEFDRWLAAHDAEKRAEWEAEQGQTEWEYGVSREVATPMSSREAAERQIERMAKRPKGYRLTANLVRRRVTPWVAAPDTTNNESEDE